MRALPLAVVLGVNFLDAPRAARGLFLDLLAHADDRGVLTLAQGQTPERAVALASPGDDPAALLSELVRVGVVTVQPAAIVLSVGVDAQLHVTEQPSPQDQSSKEEKRRADARARAKAWRDSHRAQVIEVDGTTPRTHESTQAYADRTHTRTQSVHTPLSSLIVSESSSVSTGNQTEISEKKEEKNARVGETVRTEYAPSTQDRTRTRTHESTQRTQSTEPLSLSAPAAPKAKRLQSPQPKLPWSIEAMLLALGESSGGAFVVAPFDSSLASPLSLVIRRLHEAECTLDDVRLVGEWAKAGAFHWMAGSLPGLSWLAKAGNLSNAVGQARAWRDGGKRPITAQGNRPAHKPVGQAMSTAYVSPGDAVAKGLHSLEVIRTLRERDAAAAAAKAAAKAAEQKAAGT